MKNVFFLYQVIYQRCGKHPYKSFFLLNGQNLDSNLPKNK